MSGQIELEKYSYENMLLREIGHWQFNRSHIARTYRKAVESGEKVNWDAVHSAIVQRWSYFAVEWIRREAKRKEAS